MRKKALLVGSPAPFEGPWVSIEDGEWVVEPPSSVEIWNGQKIGEGPRNVKVSGPNRIRAIVRDDCEAVPIHLDIVQVKRRN